MPQTTIQPQDSSFAVITDGKPQNTPGKKPFVLPTKALAEAIAAEWSANKKFNPSQMLLSSLAFTAIDRIEGKQEEIIEALLVYIDTDALCYRSTSSAKIIERQKAEWDPVLAYSAKKFGAIWQTTTGIDALEQPAELHEGVRDYLMSLDAMRLSAACLLASGYSSLALMISVMGRHMDAVAAYHVSRLEEEVQAEQWGKDEDTEKRSQRAEAEIAAAGRFLTLLDKA